MTLNMELSNKHVIKETKQHNWIYEILVSFCLYLYHCSVVGLDVLEFFQEKIVDLANKSSESAAQANILPEGIVDHANKSCKSAAQANILPYPPEELKMDNDGGISLKGWFLNRFKII